MHVIGNKRYVSYAVQSGELTFVFTAPYSDKLDNAGSFEPHPNFSHQTIHQFVIGKSDSILVSIRNNRANAFQ